MSYRRLLYIIGEPGSGKSTLAAALVAGRRRRVRTKPLVHTVYEDGLVQLGRERTGRGGTDVLSLSVSPQVVVALEARVWPRVLGEGDRLAHKGFFDAARSCGYELEVVLLACPDEVLEARRAQRGDNQDPRWLAGRRTKVANLRPFATLTLDATLPVEELAASLAHHPCLDPNSQEEA